MHNREDEKIGTALPVDRPSIEAPKPSILNYFHTMGGTGRFFQVFSSREKLIDGLKTFGWVAPLTLLIWIYAVREQVVQPTSPNVQNVEVHVWSSDQNRSVEYAGPEQTPTVNLELTGPQQAVELVKEKLLTGNIPHGLSIDIGSSLGIGKNQPVNIVDRVQNMDIFKNSGVTVQLSVPAELPVNIDRIISRDVPVQIPATITNLSPESRFEPAKVSVNGPASLVMPVFNGEIKVLAKLDGYEQLKHSGPQTIQAVPLVFSSPQKNLWISPNQVNADLVVTASDVIYLIPDPVPIYETMLGTAMNGYELTITGGASIANVHVKGPPQAIDALKEAIREKNSPVKAYLDVAPQDVNQDLFRTLRYQLPDGIDVITEDKSRTVEFKLIRRGEGNGG